VVYANKKSVKTIVKRAEILKQFEETQQKEFIIEQDLGEFKLAYKVNIGQSSLLTNNNNQENIDQSNIGK
jgi:hypothetical protein